MSYLSSYNEFGIHQDIALNGSSAYFINGNRITITIDAIANNRAFDNLSGTLAIELWALPIPYQGQYFSGQALAATEIGQLQGNHLLANCQYELNFTEPGAGTWYLCLMLREWNNGAYMTRDYINFSAPYVVSTEERQARNDVLVTREESNNVINVAFKEKTETAEVSQPAADTRKVASPVTKKPEVAPQKSEQKISTPSPKVSTKVSTTDTRVSINSAALNDLEAIKGVSKKLAKNIVEGRPYKKLEDLLNVKGMGKKLLVRIKSTLKI